MVHIVFKSRKYDCSDPVFLWACYTKDTAESLAETARLVDPSVDIIVVPLPITTLGGELCTLSQVPPGCGTF